MTETPTDVTVTENEQILLQEYDDLAEELEGILREDYYALAHEGFTVKSKVSEGEFVTVFTEGLGERRWVEDMRVVTRLPNGKHLEWSYGRALQEDGYSVSPEELNGAEVCEVVKFEKVVTQIVVTWGPAPTV